MPQESSSFITTGDGVRIAYRLDGSQDKPVLLLSNSIATDMHMWTAEVPRLAVDFRVLRYDARGHGESDVPVAPYSLDRLGRDVVELLDALALPQVHVLGLSLGGFVAQWLGIHVPDRIERMVLSNTAASLGPAAQWDAAIATLMAAPDMGAAADMFLRNWFPPTMLEKNGEAIQSFRRTLLATRREGVAGSWAAIRDADLRRTIALITRPALVVTGANDAVTTPSHGQEIASTIPGARLCVLQAKHLPNIEVRGEFLDLVVGFLNGA